MSSGIFQLVGNAIDNAALGYVTNISSATSAFIAPWVTGAMTLWVMAYGFAVVRGEVHEPINTFAWRAAKMSMILYVALTVGVYQSEVVGGIRSFSAELMAAVAGGNGSTCSRQGGTNAAFDCSLDSSGTILLGYLKAYSISLTKYWNPITGLSQGLTFLLCALLIFAGIVVLYAIIAIEVFSVQIALCLVFCVGPIFIACWAFEPTKKYFEGWLSKVVYCVTLQALLIIFSGLALSILTGFQQQIFNIPPIVGDQSGLINNLAGRLVDVAANGLKNFTVILGEVILLVVLGFMFIKLPGIAGGLVGHQSQTGGLGSMMAGMAMRRMPRLPGGGASTGGAMSKG